jgi:uncharacterized protein (DUF1015 family)
MELSLVAPFVGERYASTVRLGDVIAPPYDVLSPERREALARRSPYNVVHVTMPVPADGSDRYTHAAHVLERWRAEGILVRDEAPSVTVVRQAFSMRGETRARTGVIAGVAVEPFAHGRVKPHERTHAGPKEDRLALLEASCGVFEALFMVAPDRDGALADALTLVTTKKPALEADLSGVRVSVWPTRGRRAEQLARHAGAASLYIADGHHRYETAVAYRAVNPGASRVPVLIVPVGDPGLAALATHRIVRGKKIDVDGFVEAVRDRFQVRELPTSANYLEELAALRSRGTAAVVVVPGGRALALLLKGGASLGDLPFAHQLAVASLDIARVDEIIVKRLLEMAGSDADLAYSPEGGEAIDAVRADAPAAVLVNPTPVEQVLAVADAGGVMPPKATYFVPKVPSGLVGIRYE